ncbi:peptidoglycan-binding protein [Kitasatospora sp. NBC_01539]|uniref:peptidoglycan-binding domain-containing protein n=1 Tax=Kitasatospora sp. NBC_01539 TaxID=2903577 RepID=UPI0038602B46
MHPHDDLVRPYAPQAPAEPSPEAGPPTGAADLFADLPPAAAPLRAQRPSRRHLLPVLLAVAAACAGLALLLLPGEDSPGPQAQPSAPGATTATDGPLPAAAGAAPTTASRTSATTTVASPGAATASPAPTGSTSDAPGTAAGTATTTVASTAPATSAATAPADGVLRQGDSGPAVARLQQLLFGQGFTYVSRTAVFDAATLRGVTQLQHDRGLTGDPAGVYGPATRRSLEG